MTAKHQKDMVEGTDGLLSKIVGTVRSASALSAQDVDFYRSLDKNVTKSLAETSAELAHMINSTLLCIDQHSTLLEEGKEKLENARNDFSNIMDNLFEKSDRSLDILRGKTSGRKEKSLTYLDDAARSDSIPTKRILKPQATFKRPVDNTESQPFKPLLENKPHALKQLAESINLIAADEDVPEHYPQPYEYEIDNQEYNENILKIMDPIPSRPWDKSESIWVDDKKSLDSMLSELKDCSEIAVDLEHHDYRSYYGIVCLMQISTRQNDYLVDTLALRDELVVLNEVFTNPSIVKVFHGAFMDIIWLQRDLGIYVVSLFDTYHASRALGFPRHSLAYLLETLASFKTSKKYQLADWRIRPLTKPLIAYAMADTHFLLNIYDQLRNKLITENKLASVLFESRNVAKRSFQYAKYRPKIPTSSVYSPFDRSDGWRVLMRQYNLPPQKEELVKKLYEWRDTVARRDDESPRYVMPNQLLAYLVDYTPSDPAGIVSVSSTVTDHVRANSKVLANLIAKTLQHMKGAGTLQETSKLDSQVEIDHDLSQVLTVAQIKSKVAQFQMFSKVSNGVINDFRTENQQSLIFGKILASPSRFLGYENGIRHQVLSPEIHKRKQELFQTFESVNYSSTAVPEIAEDIHTNAGLKKQLLYENAATKPEKEVKEDPDEVIRLKEVSNRGKRLVKAEQGETIDYDKVQKVLDSEKKKKVPKKRAFDPYSSSDAESVPKSKKKRQMGKNKSISFKR
ncbi:related to Exosome complex exonuclease RRP6 [Zygosaccharomyces bailii]|nr:related to Exosome complex exonuclease RRP6 [Zygosaccharomyces bailii]